MYSLLLYSRSISCGTVAPYGPFFFFSFFFGPQGYGFHPIKNLRNCDQDLVAPFNSNFHTKTLCESGVMWIFRFVTYLSIVFHNYLCIIIHFQPSIITNVSILTDPAYFVLPSSRCRMVTDYSGFFLRFQTTRVEQRTFRVFQRTRGKVSQIYLYSRSPISCSEYQHMNNLHQLLNSNMLLKINV